MDLTVSGLLEAYRKKNLTPDAVVDNLYARAKQFGHLNIWIERLSHAQLEPYLERLRNIDPHSLPLYGIPFAIKDNIDLAGVPTTAACEAFAYTPAQSAFVVQRLIDAGAIHMGKTNMDQFATGLVGTRSPFGACGNSFNADYISGGSSSGSAVATALGLVSFALGTDTAGSGRVPAAFNNIVGVKPTRGIVSTRGVVPACRSLDCVSLFALTTDDANGVLELMIADDAQDDFARANSFANNQRHYARIEQPFRFAVPRDAQLEFFGNHAADDLFQQTIEKWQSLGGEKIEIDFEPFLSSARLLYEGPWVAERYIAAEKIISQQPQALLSVIQSIIGTAKAKSAVDGFRAQYALQHYQRLAKRILQEADFLLTPTAGTIFSIAEIEADPIARNSQLGYYTNFMNLLDCTAVAVPAGFLPDGLPFGISLVADKFQDRKLLSYANHWQQSMSLPLGALQQSLPATQISPANRMAQDFVPVVVCGAHLDGLPLNWQLRERGAKLLEKTTTSAHYRMYALSGGPPHRPGLLRVDRNGACIEVEIWQLPIAEFGSFVTAIPAPLGIGKLQLLDDRWLPGFICEPHTLSNAEDITHCGGWRAYLAQK